MIATIDFYHYVKMTNSIPPTTKRERIANTYSDFYVDIVVDTFFREPQ